MDNLAGAIRGLAVHARNGGVGTDMIRLQVFVAIWRRDMRRAASAESLLVWNTPRSTIDGVMHDCGHDAHASMLLGVAELLHRHPEHLRGWIVFNFQPAEETKGGADDLVNEGILRRLGVQSAGLQAATSPSKIRDGTTTFGLPNSREPVETAP